MVQLSIRYQVNRSMLLQSTVRVCKCFFVSKHILSLKFWKYILSTPNHSTGVRTFFVIITLKAFVKSQQNKKMCQSSCFGMLCFAMNCVPVLCEKYLNCEISAYKPLLSEYSCIGMTIHALIGVGMAPTFKVRKDSLSLICICKLQCNIGYL